MPQWLYGPLLCPYGVNDDPGGEIEFGFKLQFNPPPLCPNDGGGCRPKGWPSDRLCPCTWVIPVPESVQRESGLVPNDPHNESALVVIDPNGDKVCDGNKVVVLRNTLFVFLRFFHLALIGNIVQLISSILVFWDVRQLYFYEWTHTFGFGTKPTNSFNQSKRR